jgi:anaerobic ribonucleoside-triphosphate reductase activating protein
LEIYSTRRKHESRPVEGITFLGGEPTDQARPLAAVAKVMREWGWTVMTYTGHTYERLLETDNEDVNALLDRSDILVDGPFLKDQMDVSLRWRGSANQRIILLSGRYSKSFIESLPVVKGVDITFTTDGRVVVSGSQSRSLVIRLQRALRENGLIQ